MDFDCLFDVHLFGDVVCGAGEGGTGVGAGLVWEVGAEECYVEGGC